MKVVKILHIEDNEDIAELFQEMIEILGHDYEFVTDGKEGVKRVTEGNFDLIFLDITMPRFSGFDVLYELLNHHHSGKIVVITASELSTSQTSELEELEVYETIKKPVILNSLSNLLDSFEKKMMDIQH
ncbi:response regulator [Nitrosopumilus sp.]|uniref:response regulator n=1 Tax=Nitrosopumilus sp. TaxID=2024843 RepID=UPI00260ACE11|nr:response regulator [Nitrosopumilus sp.]